MPRQLWLADVLRAAGLTVHEVSGWQTRGDATFSPRGLIVHETRGPVTSTDRGEINVMVNGREGLAGPIAHLYLSRTGDWHVVNSGRTSHVKTGWAGQFSGLGNSNLLGIEAQHAEAEDWTAKPVQYRSYVRGVAAILAHTGWLVGGHKEHQPGDKTDPEFDMGRFRQDVAAARDGDDMELDQATKDTIVADTYRMAALLTGQDEARYRVSWSTEERVERNDVKAQLDRIEAKPAVQPAPVDPDVVKAAVKTALLDPEILAAFAKAVLDEDHKRSAD